MNGNLLVEAPVAVDYWRRDQHTECVKLFFLSHVHQDHIKGLNRYWRWPIYTSNINAQLLPTRIKGICLTLLKPLALGVSYSIPLDHDDGPTMQVTLFEANHCAGSVMFLFQGEFGSVFYTGDFRYKPGLLLPNDLPILDSLYLDNTYCDPSCDFPTSEEALSCVLELVQQAKLKNHKVFVAASSLGKEAVLQEISDHFSTKLLVSSSYMKTLKVLGITEMATTQPDDQTWITVVPINSINFKRVTDWQRKGAVTVIMLTALYVGSLYKPNFLKLDNIYIIPYSNHSSYQELLLFLENIKTHHIRPIVGNKSKGLYGQDISCRADMRVFSQFLIRDISEVPVSSYKYSIQIMKKDDEDEESKKHHKEDAQSSSVKELIDDEQTTSVFRQKVYKEKEHNQCFRNSNHSVLKVSVSKCFEIREKKYGIFPELSYATECNGKRVLYKIVHSTHSKTEKYIVAEL